MKFSGIINQGQIQRPSIVEEQRRRFLGSIKDGTQIAEEIKKFRPHKTRRQLGDFWGLYCPIVLEGFRDNGWDTSFIYGLDKSTGIEISADELKNYLYSVIPIYRDGERITMRDWDTKEMAEFQTKARNFASSQWGIIVPEPDKKWRKI